LDPTVTLKKNRCIPQFALYSFWVSTARRKIIINTVGNCPQLNEDTLIFSNSKISLNTKGAK
jgi:hypothetical protein